MTPEDRRELPDEIYAYPKGHGTGTWIDFDDSSPGDEATRYIRADLANRAQENTTEIRHGTMADALVHWRESKLKTVPQALAEFNSLIGGEIGPEDISEDSINLIRNKLTQP